MTRVLAVDPGGTTGLAWWDPTAQAPGWTQLPFGEDHDWLEARVISFDLVVCEAFEITQATLRKTRDGKKSMETIGVLRFLCRRAGVAFELQQPADAMKFATNDKLRRIGWWARGQEHSRDALRHLLVVCSHRRLIDLHTLIEPG